MNWFSRSSFHRVKLGSCLLVRAKRHQLSLAVQYRAIGVERNPARMQDLSQHEWHYGHTHNISATGALLETATAAVQLGDRLDLQLSLPSELVGEAHVPLLCSARVVRLEAIPQGVRFAVALERGSLVAERVLAVRAAALGPVPDIQHKVNNWLTAIVGTSELLLLNPRDAGERSKLLTIRDFALRAATELQRLQDPAA